MKNNYFESDEKQKKRAKPQKKRKKSSAGKIILIIISLIVLALAAFVITIKLLVPDYDLISLLPDNAQSFVNEDILGKTTTTTTLPSTTEATTKARPERKTLDYLEDSEFKFNTGKQGNWVGNLLNGGKVGTDYTYIYHIVDGKGIYRFGPNSESYSLFYKTDHTLSSMNLRGDFIYFVDETNGNLCKLQKGTAKPRIIGENVRFVYVYDSLVYYITNENSLCVMDAKQLTPVTVYYSADDELQFIGISKERVFFSVRSGDTYEFLTVDNFAKSEAFRFRDDESAKSAAGFVMENGYLYYYKKDIGGSGKYSVIRRKFGSQKEIELTKTGTDIGYPIADNNRLFYADWDNNKLVMKEFNMNSKKTKTMLKSVSLENEDSVSFFHGGEYDFIISDGDYRASSNLTSSMNVMKFKDNSWNY